MSALVPYSPGVQDAHEQELESAFLAKVISQDEYDERLRAHRGETRIVQLPTRMKAGTMVANTSGLWRYASGPYADKEAAWSSKKLVQHGKWAWNQTGDRKLNRCNAHMNCQVLIKSIRRPGEGTVHYVLSSQSTYKAKSSLIAIYG